MRVVASPCWTVRASRSEPANVTRSSRRNMNDGFPRGAVVSVSVLVSSLRHPQRQACREPGAILLARCDRDVAFVSPDDLRANVQAQPKAVSIGRYRMTPKRLKDLIDAFRRDGFAGIPHRQH